MNKTNTKISDYMEIKNDVIRFSNGLSLKTKLSDFPKVYKKRIDSIEKGTGMDTMEVEKKGAALMKTDMKDVKHVIDFVNNHVFKWGGSSGNRVRGILNKNQSKAKIAKVVRESAGYLHKKDIEGAISHIISLTGLSISFGSKILRMLSPRQVAVLDSVLNKCLPYNLKVKDFVAFCHDCQMVARILKKQDIKNPNRKNGNWFIADVEMVIFSLVEKK